jgi:AhpD family alkylhydroperoxidase
MGGLLAPTEQQAVLLLISMLHNSRYDAVVHTYMALDAGLSPQTVTRLLADEPLQDAHLRALVEATYRTHESPARLGPKMAEQFYEKGGSRGELYEVFAFYGMKRFSSFINHIAEPEIDAPLQDTEEILDTASGELTGEERTQIARALHRQTDGNTFAPITNGRGPSPETTRKTAEEAFGFLPNLIDELSEHNSAVAKTYLALGDILKEGTLDPDECEIVQLAVSTYNGCHYCSSAHSTMGLNLGIDAEIVDTISKEGVPSHERYRPLVEATRLMLDKRGWLDEADLRSLERQGLSRAELYEINAFIGVKTLSNYVNHVNETPVDPQIDTS